MLHYSYSPREVRNLPGGDLKNITTLRTSKEANLIATEAKGKRVVILGNSFIGKINLF
jgi:hypothetical protein